MPTYDYRCTKCGHVFELFHSIRDESTKRCPKCRSKALRIPAGGAGLLFKGTGFYITDYRSKSYRERAKQEKGGGGAGKSESTGASGSGGTTGPAAPSSGASGSGGAATPGNTPSSGPSEPGGARGKKRRGSRD